MPEPPAKLPVAKDYLPDWTTRRIVVVEKTGRWAPAISAEVRQTLSQTAGDLQPPTFEPCRSARDSLLFSELQNTVAYILFLTGLERECLGLLGRFGRMTRSLQLLVIADDTHGDLLPVLLEAGADAVLFEVRDDVAIAEWCVKALVSSGRRE